MISPWVVSIANPVIMAFLARRPNSRLYRMGVFLFGIHAAVATTLQLGDRTARRKIGSGKSVYSVQERKT